MRNPVRSETDAFHIAVGSAAVLVVSVVLGAVVSPVVGIVLFVGAVAGAVIWEFATNDPDRRRPLREAAAAGHRNARPGRRRVLVVANRTLVSDALRAELARRARDGAEVRVVVPILVSRIHYVVSDVDAELREARERLADALAWAHADGVEVTGRVGDPSVALGAIEDELRQAGADEILISTLPRGQSNWLETGILERLREDLEIPVTHVEAAPSPAAH